jgi:hypothetical protein
MRVTGAIREDSGEIVDLGFRIVTFAGYRRFVHALRLDGDDRLEMNHQLF